jgi:hypothetical protein
MRRALALAGSKGSGRQRCSVSLAVEVALKTYPRSVLKWQA